MKLIDKDALVAKIENWKQYILKCGYKGQGDYEDGNKQGRLDTCDKFLSFLDTLEVKEVDLDEQDIYNILILERFILREVGDKECSNEEICKEVLKRFKERRNSYESKMYKV